MNHRAEDPALCNDPALAQKVMRDRQLLEKQVTGFRALEGQLDDACTLIELGEMEGDEAAIGEGEDVEHGESEKWPGAKSSKGRRRGFLQLSNDGQGAQRVRKLPTRGSFHGNVSPE